MAVSKTTDGGLNWSRSQLTPSYGFTYALAIDPTNSLVVYAGGDPEIYKTTDGGASWTSISAGITEYADCIVVHPTNPSTVYVATRGGVFKSTNGGTSWNSCGLTEVTALCIDPSSPDSLYAGTIGGVYCSTNGGLTWTEMNNGLESTNISSLGIDAGDFLYAGTYDAGMSRWALDVGIMETDVARNAFAFATPNPFRDATVLQYAVPYSEKVELNIYDVQGRVVNDLVHEVQAPGMHTVFWDGMDKNNNKVPAGIYFCRLFIGHVVHITKILHIK
jgi:hypothetical protein